MPYSRVLLLTALLCVPFSAHSAERWVSLNQCLDQLLLDWAPERLVGITSLSEIPPDSQVQQHNGSLEGILSQRPTKVIATEFNNQALLRRLANYVEVEVLPQPQSWSSYQQWLEQWRSLGLEDAVQQRQRHIQRLLAQLQKQAQTVVTVMPNQWSWGSDSWADAIYRRLGWTNIVAEEGRGLVALSLEQLWQWQPNKVILEGFNSDSFALAYQWQQHPIFQNWLAQQQAKTLPREAAACPVVKLADYLEALL